MKAAFRLVTLLLSVFALSIVAVIFAQDEIEFPEPTGSIAVDNEVTGELSEDNPLIVYTFDGAAGEIVGVNVAFDEIDGYLLLADADGNILAENDDSISIYNSTIPAVELPEDGNYQIGISTYSYVRTDDPSEEGSFRLTLATPEVSSVEIGDEIEGAITEDQPTALYFIDAEVGQLLVVAVESDDFDTQLALDPVSGQDVIQEFNDDFGEGTNSQIGPTLIAEGGRYVVTVSSFFEDEAGSFTLSVSEAEALPLEVGEAARGEVTADASEQFYSFQAEEGQQLTISATAVEDADLVLDLYNPGAELVAYNNDTDDLNPVIEYTADETGTYLVRVYPATFFFEESESRQYDITVTTGAASR